MSLFPITVDDSVLRVRLNSFDARVKARLIKVMRKLSIDLTTRVQVNKLSGQVLRNRTGALRSSIHPTGPTVTATGVTAGAGTNLVYAAFHEYGFHGTEAIRSHLRTLKSGKTSQVRAHSRTINYPAHSYLRSTLREMAPEIVEAIHQAVVVEARAKS